MLETDALYKRILSDPEHWEENRLIIADPDTDDEIAVYYDENIDSIETLGAVFDSGCFSIGGATVGRITTALRVKRFNAAQLSTCIPRAAKLKPEVRICRDLFNSELIKICHEDSDWYPQGHFYVDTRDAPAESSRLTLFGYDPMELANAEFPSIDNWTGRETTIDVVSIIARAIGVEVDPATLTILRRVSGGVARPYAIGVPPVNYTMRETLGFIAAMHAGNFVISKEGKLLLLTANSLPTETNLLINEIGDYITFGGTRILLRS